VPEPTRPRRWRAGAQDLACLYRRDGLTGVLRRLGGRLAHAVYAGDDHLIIRKDLTEQAPAPPEGAFRLERAGHQHLPLVARFNARRCYRRATNAFRDRLDRGYIGLVALLDGQMVGWIWCADPRRHPHDAAIQRYRIPDREGDVYAFDLILAEAHRGQGNATALLDQIHAALASLGYRAMWGYVESDNVPSRWLFAICGHAVVGRSRGRRILSRLVMVDRRVYLQGPRGLRPLLGR
jgi:GNAT superfamily N-acetyltransferase